MAYAEIGPAPVTGPERFLWKRSPEVANPGSGSKRAPQWDLPAGCEYSKRNLKHGPAPSPTYQVITVRVAWWLVIVCYGIPWLAGWGWWQARKARIIRRDWPGEA